MTDSHMNSDRNLRASIFGIVVLTPLVAIMLYGSYRLHLEDAQTDAWTITDGTIAKVSEVDCIETVQRGRKWRRRTEQRQARRRIVEYTYRDNFGYKHNGSSTTFVDIGDDWRNGRVRIVTKDNQIGKTVKVFYNPRKTFESSLGQPPEKSTALQIVVLIMAVIAAVVDAFAIKHVVRRQRTIKTPPE